MSQPPGLIRRRASRFGKLSKSLPATALRVQTRSFLIYLDKFVLMRYDMNEIIMVHSCNDGIWRHSHGR